MGRPLSQCAHRMTPRVLPVLIILFLVSCLVVCPMGSAFATSPSDDSVTTEQYRTSEEGASEDSFEEGAGESEADDTPSDQDGSEAGALSTVEIPEAGTNTSNPIKPRPKVEITTGVVAIEQTSDESITEEGVPLGVFDPSACVFHVWMLVGIALTIAYTFFAWYRIRRHELSLDAASRSLVGKPLASMEAIQRKSVKASSPSAANAEN